ARSFLSLLSNGSTSSSIGTHPLIARFLRGVSKTRPPCPRYNTTWDPANVLTFLESLEPLEDLPIQKLAYKVIGLMSLATAHRVQTFSLIHLDEISHKEQVFAMRQLPLR
ncbi:unnamed protein product, partial [Allacma fusca]